MKKSHEYITVTIPLESDPNPLGRSFEFLSTNDMICIYAAIVLILIVAAVGSAFFFYNAVVSISKTLHNNMFQSLLCAPTKFFDLHPSGTILNRFSRDMGIVDQLLPPTLYTAITVIPKI